MCNTTIMGRPMEADAKDNAYFSVDSKGLLAFTERGMAEYRSYFGKAGIDIRTIKSVEDFRKARQGASPFFDEHLTAKVKKGEKTLERRLLIAMAESNEDEIKRLERLLDAEDKGIKLV
ncbi:hypothetical protein [Methyloglobulus sp.]|uniref:hypothetical protein n=1 Tax=Methyloglobulus sp. TaxID=2518622 RepID=UPI0032B76B6F